jgi:hypothetical protein
MTKSRFLIPLLLAFSILLPFREITSGDAPLIQKGFFSDLQMTRFTKSVAQEHWGKDIFSDTRGIMVMDTPIGMIMFVCDAAWGRVCWMEQDRMDIYAFGSEQLWNPHDVAGRFPYVFVADPGAGQVSKYRIVINDDNVSIEWTKDITDIGEDSVLEWPYGVDYSDNGTPDDADDDVIYVADAYHRRIYKFDAQTGNFISFFGEQRIDIRDFHLPTDVAVGYDYQTGSNTRDIFVLDAGLRKKVVAYCDTPRTSPAFYLHSYEFEPDCDLTSIATDCRGYPYVSDARNDRIIKLTRDLQDTLWTYGSHGFCNGRFNEIHDVYFLRNELFVAEKWTDSSGISCYWLKGETIFPREWAWHQTSVRICPNPVRTYATISYATPKPGHTSVKVYDTSGKLVETLYSGREHEGILVWNAKDAPAGTYFVNVKNVKTRAVKAIKVGEK